MRILSVITLFVIGVLLSCKGKEDGSSVVEDQHIDTIPMMVQQIQSCSRLYTAEYQVHKIVTHDDVVKVGGKVLGRDVNVSLPMGKRKIAIPIDVTLKAYIDFSGFSENNVRREGNKVEVTLPAPHVMVTSTSVDHDGVHQYVALLRSNFSDAELTNYEKQGRQAVIAGIPQLGILDAARQSAAKQLIPIIAGMGYNMENVTITFVDKSQEKGGVTWFVD